MPESIQNNYCSAARIWSVVVLTMIGLLTWELLCGVKFETNILKLLPPTEQDPHVEKAVNNFAEHLSRRLVFLADDKNAASALAELLEATTSFTDVQFKVEDREDHDFYETFFPYREFLPGNGDVVEQAKQLLYSPMSAAFSRTLEDDPLLLFPSFLKSLPEPPGTIAKTDGFLTVQDKEITFYVVQANMRGSPFSRKDQRTAVQEANSLLHKVYDIFPHADILTTGMVYFAEAGARSAETEASIISTGSIIGVILLIFFTFRSLRHVLMSLLPIAVGFLCAFSISFLIFPKVHLITMGFGASLIGVCIDYSFHYFAEQYALRGERWDPRLALKHITPGITLGLITSIMGYIGLLIAPFPGLRQMAVFSSVGLIGAFGTVYCWYPVLSRKVVMENDPLLLKLADRLIKRPPPLIIITVIVLVTSALFIPRIKTNDDIRLLQTPNHELVTQEKRIREMMGGVDGGRFLVVRGDSPEQVLQREETLQNSLADLKRSGTLGYYQGISTFIPSRKTQKARHEKLIKQQPQILAYLAETGFEQTVINKTTQRLQNPPSSWITLRMLENNGALSELRHLWIGEQDDIYSSIVVLGSLEDELAVEALESLPGVAYVDKVRDVSNVLSRYRIFAGKAVFVSYAVIALFLAWRYGVRRFPQVFFPPCMAALLTISLLSATGDPINIFHYLAILLVLGIGIDYTIFFAESRSGNRCIMLAVLSSAITTILSFGLLSLSSTQALSGFGKTVFLGILFALAFSPVAGINYFKHDEN